MPKRHKKAEADTVIPEPLTRIDVRKAADSLIDFYLGKLSPYCAYKKKGYYSYIDSNTRKMHWCMLSKHKKIKGILRNVFMSYQLDYPYPACEPYNRITGTIYLKMDSNLSADRPDLSFIPDFVWTGETCRLISAQKAIELAINYGFKESDKPPKTRIEYDKKVKQFYWFISNRIPKDSTIQKRFVTQTMQINAFTKGKVSYSKTGKQPPTQY